MLHELLLALGGHCGGLFIKDERGKVQLVADLPYIHESEIALLNRICRLATHFTGFIQFIRESAHSPGGGDVKGLHGLYMRAFSQGLDEILNPYREALLDLEKQLMGDSHLTAAHVQHHLEEYQLLFPALSNVTDQIKSQKAHGCHVLEILHKSAVCGTPIVKNALRRIQHVCHTVMYKQLAAWMLHGMLLDKFEEFFVHKVEKSASSQTDVTEEDDLGLGGVTSSQIQQLLQLVNSGSESGGHAVFSVRAEMLPSYIPMRIAEKILFVGESVEMFECDKQKFNVKSQGSIMRDKEVDFAKALQEMSKQADFNIMDFEAVIDKIRPYAAEQLWKLIVEEADLLNHLKIMKDFFLLGRGELFLAFIDQAQSLLRVPPSGTTQHDINMAFQQAARNVLFEDDSLLQKFKFSVDFKEKGQIRKLSSESTVSESGWSSLNLVYTSEWPLHILFTPGVLTRYNTLFKFLLFVKRIQLDLQHCWALQMRKKHEQTQDMSKWWLRNHMAFLIDNLQYYLQVDVIESQFSILQDKVQKIKDFEEIRLAHDQFLTSLLSQSFLLMKPIAHCLNEILELCHSFCKLYTLSDIVLTARESEMLENITKKFQRQSNLLFTILSSVRSHQASPHLAQLLLRIDFNKYFTLSGGQLGSNAVLPLGQKSPISSRQYFQDV